MVTLVIIAIAIVDLIPEQDCQTVVTLIVTLIVTLFVTLFDTMCQTVDLLALKSACLIPVLWHGPLNIIWM